MNDEFNFDNEIIEIGSEEKDTRVMFNPEDTTKSKKKKTKKEKKDNVFKRFSNWFKGLDKKKKIIFITITSIVVILIICLIVFST